MLRRTQFFTASLRTTGALLFVLWSCTAHRRPNPAAEVLGGRPDSSSSSPAATVSAAPVSSSTPTADTASVPTACSAPLRLSDDAPITSEVAVQWKVKQAWGSRLLGPRLVEVGSTGIAVVATEKTHAGILRGFIASYSMGGVHRWTRYLDSGSTQEPWFLLQEVGGLDGELLVIARRPPNKPELLAFDSSGARTWSAGLASEPLALSRHRRGYLFLARETNRDTLVLGRVENGRTETLLEFDRASSGTVSSSPSGETIALTIHFWGDLVQGASRWHLPHEKVPIHCGETDCSLFSSGTLVLVVTPAKKVLYSRVIGQRGRSVLVNAASISDSNDGGDWRLVLYGGFSGGALRVADDLLCDVHSVDPVMAQQSDDERPRGNYWNFPDPCECAGMQAFVLDLSPKQERAIALDGRYARPVAVAASGSTAWVGTLGESTVSLSSGAHPKLIRYADAPSPEDILITSDNQVYSYASGTVTRLK